MNYSKTKNLFIFGNYSCYNIRLGLFMTVFIMMISTIMYASDYDRGDYLDTKIVLFPIQETTVASLVDSFIETICFKEGVEFKKGDTLVKLDKSLYRQAYNVAKSRLTGAEAAFKYAENIYKHNIELYKKNAIGSQELEKSEMDKIEALSNLEQAKANLTISEIKLNSCSVKAPFSGRAIVKELNEYDYVRTGQPILHIINDNQLLAAMNLSSSKLNKVKLGMSIELKIDETGTKCTGRVYEIAGSINPSSRTFEVKVVIDNKDKKLLAGMSGKLLTEF